MSAFSESLFLPAAVLACLAWVVPKLLSLALREGVKPLLFNAFLSALFLFALSAAFFVALYVWQGVPLGELMRPGLAYNVTFFGRLGLSAAIIWAPIMILSVANLPRHSKEVEW